MKDLQERLTEQSQQLQAARSAELDLRKRQRELEEQRQTLDPDQRRIPPAH